MDQMQRALYLLQNREADQSVIVEDGDTWMYSRAKSIEGLKKHIDMLKAEIEAEEHHRMIISETLIAQNMNSYDLTYEEAKIIADYEMAKSPDSGDDLPF